jgi:hypothetical protein
MKVGDLVYHKQSFVDAGSWYVGYVGGIVPSSCEQHYEIIWLDGTESSWYSKEEVERVDAPR